MPRHKIILLGGLSVLIILLACRGEPAPPPSKTPAPPAVRPTLVELPSPLPQDSAAAPGANAPTLAATVPTATATPLPPSQTAVLTPMPPRSQPFTPTAVTPTEAPSTAPATPPAEESAEDVAEIRRIISEYWEAMNKYDVDRAIMMLEPAYRVQEEELIRQDIGRMKLFRVKLDVSEDIPPTLNDNGDYETYLSMATPIDTRTVLMVLRRIADRWWIVFSDEVE